MGCDGAVSWRKVAIFGKFVKFGTFWASFVGNDRLFLTCNMGFFGGIEANCGNLVRKIGVWSMEFLKF